MVKKKPPEHIQHARLSTRDFPQLVCRAPSEEEGCYRGEKNNRRRHEEKHSGMIAINCRGRAIPRRERLLSERRDENAHVNAGVDNPERGIPLLV
ncbi:hypothetical protein [Shinella sumterensis]|uniref:Uncharacterized protein n=1 Tax=Shinella sumterensis TaxID=1967501 RepID=A0AA50H9V6_9HYPH|nr:hypothetical protein [Shinella sumterensis]WLS00683.1 hypothetical protein Q9313_25270 [Shinella sumterensis]